MTTQLIINTTLQPSINTQLPEVYLHSEDFYCTQEAYEILLSFEDDDELQDMFNQNQVSDGLIQEIDIQIDRLFSRDNCPDVFDTSTLRELRSYISNLLDTVPTVVIN